jgi:hypothetical protein
LNFPVFIVLGILIYFLFIRKYRSAGRWRAQKGSILPGCLLPLLCLVGLIVFIGAPYSDELRAAKNLYLFVRDITWALFDMSQNLSLDKTGWNREDEAKFVKAEDPSQTRLLYNRLDDYDWVQEKKANFNFGKETIILKVSRTRVRPGTKVSFEATPSPDTPKMSFSILLSCSPYSHTTSLNRAWLGFGKKYRGSFTFKKTDSGEFRFYISTMPRIDKKTKEMVSYESNAVSVFVAPDRDQLTGIRLQAAQSRNIVATEGFSDPVSLIADGKDGTMYNISSPGLGTIWSVDDESIAVVSDEMFHGAKQTMVKGLSAGKTTIRASYEGLQAEASLLVFRLQTNFPPRMIRDPNNPNGPSIPEPPPVLPDPPRAISLPDGAVVRKGERVILEATSFDVSKGHSFKWSRWDVFIVDPDDNVRGPEVANLRRGNSNTAEWIPRGTGTFEWIVTYFYSGSVMDPMYFYLRPAMPPVESIPVRIIVVE